MKCPCCGGDIEEVPHDKLLAMRWSPIEKTIVRNMIKRYPDGIRVDQLMLEIYGTRNRQPEYAMTSMHVIMMVVRKKLAAVGWQVPKVRGKQDPVYRLEKIQ